MLCIPHINKGAFMKKGLFLIIAFAAVCSLILLSGCISTEPAISPMQKRQITTRLIYGSYDNIFASVITIFQDNEYIIKNTDKSTGLITAEVSRDSGFFNKLFVGRDHYYISGTRVDVNAMVNKISSSNCEVRIRIQESTFNNAGGVTNVNQVYDEAIYSGFFNSIQTEVKRREAMNR